MSVYIDRINSIKKILKENDGAFISSDVSITYLTGFAHSEGYVLLASDAQYFLVDFRYAEAAKNTVKDYEVIVFSNPFESIDELIKKHSIKNLLIEDSSVTLASYNNLCDKLSADIVTGSELSKTISNTRLIKSADEVEKLKTAQKIAEKAYLEVLNFVKEGISEKEIAARLEFLMKMYGAERVAFDLITITGKNTSLPHGVPSDTIVKKGDFVTFDIGAVYEGYHSDMTRTVAVGCISDEQKEIYDIVLKAHFEGLKSVKAGVSGFDVDKAARDVIVNAGYGQYFGHATGHGVGLEVHEAPNASPRSEYVLSENMTLTVEPGIYLPQKFGVRIEDTVLVTLSGYESFASVPKDLLII